MIRNTSLILMILLSTVAAAEPSSPAAIKNDYSNLCNALERSGASKEKDNNRRAELIAKYLRTALKTPEVNAFFRKLGDGNPKDTGPAVKKAASAAGYTGACPIAEPTKGRS
jgi:hypothetical protein